MEARRVKGASCIIDGKRVRSWSDLYDCLGRELALPDNFDRSIDALWEMLTMNVEGPLEIVWQSPEISRKAMGRDFVWVVALLHEVSVERSDIRVIFE
jgi:ribonuclease inhibitor